MLKRRILASSMASVMALTSVVGVAFADEAEKNYVSAKTLKDYVKKMEDKKTDDFGSVSTATFEKALNYAETVVGDSDATNDEIAVAYLMLKAAEDALAVHSAEDLNGLLTSYKKDYDSANILNDVDDINDSIYDEDTYADFEYEYENAESVVDGSDKKAITDAYEELEKAHDALKALPSVTKADFAREIARLQQAQKKEFDYHAWQRGTVSGTGTDYDGQTVAWGVLFYHVWSAFDAINAEFGTIKDVKTLNRTTNGDVVDAYKACQQAVKVLSGFTPAKTKSYRNEESVTNLVNKTYKNKLLANDDFVKQLLTETVSTTNGNDMWLDADNTVELSTVWTGSDWVSGKGASDIVKKGKITLYGAKDGSTSGAIEVDASEHKIKAKADAGDNNTSIEIFSVEDADFCNDLIQILGKMTEPTKQLNTIWDGNTAFNKKATLGDDEKLAELATVKIVTTAAADKDNPSNATWTTSDSLDGTDGPTFATSTHTSVAEISKSKDIASVLLSPTVKGALTALNGGTTYAGDNKIAAGTLAAKSAGDKKTAEQTIISSKAVDLDNLDDEKVSTNEWTAIGNFLDCALSEWLDEPETVSYTVNQADKLIDDSDEVLEITAQAAVFATLNDALVEKRDLLLENANSNRRTTDKKVDKETYENCKKAFDNLKKALDGFKYSYEDVQKTLADVAKQLDDSSSALHGDATVAQDLKDVAKYFIKVSDLATNGDDMIDDVVNDSYEFAGYNRVYTAEGETDVGDGIKISKAKDGANKAHYELTQAYEKLLADHEEALKGPSGDANYDFDGDKVVDTLDVIALNKAIANEETIDLKFDLDGDSAVTSLDAKELAYRIAQELV